MKLGLITSIARALMTARIRQTMVATAGVTFSITMFITLLGFMNGLNLLLDGLILNRTPHIRLYNDIQPNPLQPINNTPEYKGSYNIIRSVKPNASRENIYNSAAIMKILRNDDRVFGVAPKISTNVFFNVGSTDVLGIVNGVDVFEENRLFNFADYVSSGNYMDLKYVPNSIILGKGAADRILADIGDVIQVTTSQGNQLQLKVVGYFQSGLKDIDAVQCYASLTTVQKMIGQTSSYVTDIQVKLNDLDQAPEVAREYEKKFGIDVDDIKTVNAQYETGSGVRSLISYAVGITLLIVSGFGIYNILNMMIYEKMDTIAILKATGFSGGDVSKIFITIAVSIGIAGGFAGMVLGYLACLGIDQVPFETEAIPGVTTFPIDYSIRYYIIAAVFSLVTTYFAGFFPARKAGRIDPVDIIRRK